MTDEDSNKLEHLRWIFDKQISWISSSEIKATTFIALNFAIFAVLGTLFELKTITKQDLIVANYSLIYAAATVLFSLIALCFLLFVFSPRLKVSPTTHSFLYFNLIVNRLETHYTVETPKQDYKNLAEDVATQIFSNAKIAKKKHSLIKKGMYITFFSIILAIIAIGAKISNTNLNNDKATQNCATKI